MLIPAIVEAPSERLAELLGLVHLRGSGHRLEALNHLLRLLQFLLQTIDFCVFVLWMGFFVRDICGGLFFAFVRAGGCLLAGHLLARTRVPTDLSQMSCLGGCPA